MTEFKSEEQKLVKKRVRLMSANDIEPEDVSFLMDGYLAKGKLHVLAGPPGVGKTTLALALGAIVSSGDQFPTGDVSNAGNVIVWSGEDGIADTILPRFLASGGDRGRLWVIDGTDDAKGSRSFDPAKDVAELQNAVDEIGGCDLLVVDPIVSAVAGDGHKNNDVRRSLQPLVDLAAATGAAVIGISHLTKGTSGRDPVERVSGSLAYGALARVVLFATKERPPEDGSQPRCIFMRAKSNVGLDTGGFMYSLERKPVPGYAIEASIVRFEEPIEGSARQILAQAEEMQDAEGGSALAEAKEFLQDLLSVSLPASEIRSAANKAFIPWITIRHAKDALGVRSRKIGFGKGWEWFLPDEDEDALSARENAHQKTMSTFANNDPLRSKTTYIEPIAEENTPSNAPKVLIDPEGAHCFGGEHVDELLHDEDGGVDI